MQLSFSSHSLRLKADSSDLQALHQDICGVLLIVPLQEAVCMTQVYSYNTRSGEVAPRQGYASWCRSHSSQDKEQSLRARSDRSHGPARAAEQAEPDAQLPR